MPPGVLISTMPPASLTFLKRVLSAGNRNDPAVCEVAGYAAAPCPSRAADGERTKQEHCLVAVARARVRRKVLVDPAILGVRIGDWDLGIRGFRDGRMPN